MKSVSQGEGRTVLFVSHNMQSVKALCRNGILLKNGQMEMAGEISDVVEYYLQENQADFSRKVAIVPNRHRPHLTNCELEIIEAEIMNDNEHLATDEPLEFVLRIKKNDNTTRKFTVGLMIDDNEESRVGSYVSPVCMVPENKSEFLIHITLRNHNLARGIYRVGFNIGHKEIEYGLRDYDVLTNVLALNVVNVTKNTPIVLWQKQWGSTNYRDAEIKIE